MKNDLVIRSRIVLKKTEFVLAAGDKDYVLWQVVKDRDNKLGINKMYSGETLNQVLDSVVDDSVYVIYDYNSIAVIDKNYVKGVTGYSSYAKIN